MPSFDPTLIAEVTNVLGDTITASVLPGAAPGLTYSHGHAYFVGQVGAYVRIPLGLIDVFAIVVQVGSSETRESTEAETIPGRPWMKLELLGEAHRNGSFDRGVSRYPSIGDRVVLVTARDLNRIYDADDTTKSVKIGHVSNAPHLPALIDVSRLVTRHAAVVGSTGSGKSTAVAGIVSAITNPSRFPSARILILDVHGEYLKSFGERAHVLKVDAREADSTQTSQLVLPYWALPFDDFLELALGAVDEASSAAIQTHVLESKKRYAVAHPGLGVSEASVTADTPLPFSVRKLWYYLHQMHYGTHTVATTAQTDTTFAYALSASGIELRGDAETITPPQYLPATLGGPDRIFQSGSLLNVRRQTDALGTRLRDPRFHFLFRPGPWGVDAADEVEQSLGGFLELWLGGVRPIVIADLSGVPNQILQKIVSVLLRLLYDSLIWARKMSEGAKERPLLVVLEEAHRYLNEREDAAGEIVERIVKEGRKFGIGVLIVSQRPSEIRATVLSQIGSFVVLRLSNASDRGLVQATLPDNLASLFSSVPVLRTGEAILSGEVSKMPSRITIDVPPELRPDSSDPDVVGRSLPGGWDASRVPQDYDDVAWAWTNLTPDSRKMITGP